MTNVPTPRLCLFGPPRIEIGGVSLDRFPTKRSVYILARVAIANQKRMSRAQLAEVLWPEDHYEDSRTRLRQELSRLRRSLGAMEPLLVSDAEWVRLDMSTLEFDADEFERLIRMVRQSEDPARRESLLRRAVALAAAPFMAGSVEDWIVVERIRLNVGRYGALVDLGALLLESANYGEALALAQEAIEIAPEREAAHLLAIQALLGLGHVDDARTQVQLMRRSVVTEHGGRLSARAERTVADLSSPAVDQRSEPHVGLTFAVPAPAEPIFGRDDTLVSIVERLDPDRRDARLLTVIGMGGIGKTHLLLYACRELCAAFRDRVSYVDLSNLADPKLILPAVLRALGLGHVPTADPIRQITRLLGDAPAVLALDNLEQFGAAAGPVVRRLLNELPAIRILAGSRTALNIAGEIRLSLSPLSLPEESAQFEAAKNAPAMRLFLNLLETDRIGGAPLESDWPILSNIVRRLEGVPLGLQLAASRMRTLGPAALLHDLDEGLTRLVNRREDAPPRHRSMRNAVSGSFDNLGPTLRRAIASLSIFRGGWTLDSAARVCGIEDVTETMEQLVDASLVCIVIAGARIRFRMLEPIRDYARSLLNESQTAELRREFVNWMVERSRIVAHDLVDKRVKDEIDRLEPEMDNIWEALRYALDDDPDAAFELGANLSSFWLFRTSGFEANQFYSQLFLRHDLHPDSPDRLRSSYGHTLISHFMQADDRLLVYDRTIRIGRAIGDRSFEIKTRVFQAFAAQNDIRYAECLAYLDEIDQFVAEHGSYESDAFVSRIKGVFVQYQGDPQTAIQHYRDAMAWFVARGEVYFQARCRLDLAAAAIDLDDIDLADAVLAGLLAHAHETRFASLIPLISGCMGVAALKRGKYKEAIELFERSLLGWQEIGGEFFQQGDQWNCLGRTFIEEGRLAESRSAFAKAADIWMASGHPVAAALAVYGLAYVCMREGEHQRVARLCAVAKAEFQLAGAKLIRFHTDFIDRLEAELRDTLSPNTMPSRSTEEDSLTLEEAIALGSVAA